MKKKVYTYIHTHWDREWYREYEEFRVRLVEVFDDVLKKLQNKELNTFYFDGQTAALEDYLEIKPQNSELVKDLIKQKRLFIGPYYCSTDSFLVDSESLIKNLQLGLEYSKQFGCEDYIAYHADTFGHSRYIPQIIKYFNIPYAIFWRGLGELESEFLYRNLKSIYLIQGYFHDYFSLQVSMADKVKMLKNTLDKIAKYSSGIILLPLGADHLATPDNIKEQINQANALLEDYEIILSTPFEYLKQVDNNFNRNLDCEFRDTKRNFILPGVYSSRIDLKQLNTKHQWNMSRFVQPLQAVTSFLGITKSYQHEVDYIYKLLIKNHPHDSIYGCSVDNVHRENLTRFLKVQEASNAIVNSIKRDLYKTGKDISVINLSNFKLNGALKIVAEKLPKEYNAQKIKSFKAFPLLKMYDINQVPVTEDYQTYNEYLIDVKDIPPFSTAKVSQNYINKKSSLKITDTSIENAKTGLYIQNGKVVLKDKTNNKTYKNFISFIDRADIGDSYNFGALKGDKPVYAKFINSKVKQKGHIQSILQLKFEISIPAKSTAKGRSKKVIKHTLKLDAILQNQNDFIEFNLNWENKSSDHILQVLFNFDKPVNTTVSDDLAGYVKREFDPDYDIYAHIPAPRGIELKNNTAPFQKLLLVQGCGIITEGLQEYEISKTNLMLTLLRATGTISNPKNPCRGTPAGPPLPTPDLQLLGERNARFAISFNENIQACEKDVEKFYETADVVRGNLASSTLFETGNENIFVTTIKTNNEGDLIIRFLNKSDKKQELKFQTQLKNSGIFYTDAMEKITEPYKDSVIGANSFVTLVLKSDIAQKRVQE